MRTKIAMPIMINTTPITTAHVTPFPMPVNAKEPEAALTVVADCEELAAVAGATVVAGADVVAGVAVEAGATVVAGVVVVVDGDS